MERQYRQNLDVAWRRIRGQDSAILIMPMDSNVLGLNEVGARIWELVEEWRTIPSIVTTILEEYEVAPDEAEADARELLDELVQRSFVESREEP